MEFQQDVIYSEHCQETRLMDLYIPDANPKRAALLFIHGGGWEKGNKEQFRAVAEWFCERGFFCASMRYHLSGQRTYPAALEDARLGLQFVQSVADRYGFDPAQVVTLGSSAGGYLAAMLGLIRPDDSLGRTAELRDDLLPPHAVAIYCPVTSLHTGQRFVTTFMGGTPEEKPELYEGASPVERIHGGEPPFLIIVGDQDQTTPVTALQLFANKLTDAGGQAELIVLEGVGHGFCYGITTKAQQDSCEYVLEFLNKQF